MNSFNKKVGTHGHVGPGGLNCVCCGPAPGKKRKLFFRAAKRRAKAFWRKLIAADLTEPDIDGAP